LGPVLVILSYLLGSIPTAYIAGRVVKGVDIRRVGDGNVGAANTFREISPGAGWLVMIADISKGALAAVATLVLTSQTWALLAGISVLIGHILPIYIGFRGGRGEATAAGVLLVLFPLPMLALTVIASLPFLIVRNTMILGAMLFAPLWLILWLKDYPAPLVVYSILLPVIVGLAHLITTRRLSLEVRRNGRFMR
jgi:acyl phosphate:glycerol-3-phosphate acyltransferase